MEEIYILVVQVSRLKKMFANLCTMNNKMQFVLTVAMSSLFFCDYGCIFRDLCRCLQSYYLKFIFKEKVYL